MLGEQALEPRCRKLRKRRERFARFGDAYRIATHRRWTPREGPRAHSRPAPWGAAQSPSGRRRLRDSPCAAHAARRRYWRSAGLRRSRRRRRAPCRARGRARPARARRAARDAGARRAAPRAARRSHRRRPMKRSAFRSARGSPSRASAGSCACRRTGRSGRAPRAARPDRGPRSAPATRRCRSRNAIAASSGSLRPIAAGKPIALKLAVRAAVSRANQVRIAAAVAPPNRRRCST